MNENEKTVLNLSLCDGKFRCPVCYEDGVKHIPTKRYSGVEVFYPRKMLKSKRYYCFNCKTSFKDIKKLALVDGIFLDRNTDLKERSKRYVEEVCKKLVLSNDVQEKAIEILNDYNEKWGYRDVAAASIYISALLCGERKSQTRIAYELNTTEHSICRCYRDIAKVLDLEIFLKKE